MADDLGDDQTEQSFKAETEEQFAALGRFVQAFEHVINSMRMTIANRLQTASPELVEMSVFLLNHDGMTAWPVWQVYRSMVSSLVPKDDPSNKSDTVTFTKVLRKIAAEFEELIKLRNSIVHGTPMIGWTTADKTRPEKMRIHKWKVGATGFSAAKLPESASELLQVVKRCRAVNEAVILVYTAATSEENAQELLNRALASLRPPSTS